MGVDQLVTGGDVNDPVVDSVTSENALIIPVYDDLSNYPNPGDGELAYATGNGPQSEGVFSHDGSSWQGPFGSGGGGAFSDTDSDNVAELVSGLTGVSLGDDERIRFGDGDDGFIEWDTNNNVLLIRGSDVRVVESANNRRLTVQSSGITTGGGGSFSFSGSNDGVQFVDQVKTHTPQDVRNISNPGEGDTAYHDGSGPGLAGPADYAGSNWRYHAGATESAAADTPQGTYAPGQVVYFTDSDDGSGTGTYIIDDSGTPQGPI